jgi:DNA-binding CsgD family transcriptional regulator
MAELMNEFIVQLMTTLQARQQDGQARASDCQPLSAREREVLQILAEGLSTAETADRLGITANTVRRHLAHSMDKLGVHSKIEVIIRAIDLGLIEVPG